MSAMRKLVPRNGTYLCSMQGNMCRITILGGRSPPRKKWGIKLQHIYVKVFSWLDMRQDLARWLIIKVREAIIRLNKASKTHDNAITT